jgi:NADH:ubiquinone oxidoreductase subunit 2 (subunit N)
MLEWMFDSFCWIVLPIAALEAIRVARSERKRLRRSMPASVAYGLLEFLALGFCAATGSLLLFLLVMMARLVVVRARERQWWVRGPLKALLIGVALVLLMAAGVDSFADVGAASLDDTWRTPIIVLLCIASVLAVVPVRVADEPKETLAAPVALIAFARVALPLGGEDAQFVVVVPIVAVALSLLCALWLFSAGQRANHFEPSTLVSELLVCERGVMLSFVWMGLASGEHLAGIGALLEWWSGTLALLALEASLRRRPLVKPMAFFALAMAVHLPGTLGFVAEDLLAHGLLEARPVLAAGLVCVAAINAAALYLAIVNVIVDVRGPQHHHHQHHSQAEPRPSFMMLVAAGLSLLMGLVPRPFVAAATDAHRVIAHPYGDEQHPSAAHYGGH